MTDQHEQAEHKLDVPKLAVAYRRLVLWFVLQWLVGMLGYVAIRLLADPELQFIVGIARLALGLVTVVALGYYAFRTAQAIGSRVAVLWAIAMLVPCVNVITLLVLSSRATTACRQAGVEVGLLGPKNYKKE
jgi:hypothetical protein